MTRVVRVLIGLVVAGVFVVAAGAGLLHLFNPVADEWHCSQGKAPATYEAGGSACLKEGSKLPEGVTWDPLGNRPMSYNCEDEDGWVLIQRPVDRPGGAADSIRDCALEGSELPPGWRVVPEG